MRGNNELLLNGATIVEALQLWADHTFKTPVVVRAVKQNASNGSFVVNVTEPEPKAKSIGREFQKLAE